MPEPAGGACTEIIQFGYGHVGDGVRICGL
jgi:hypothetical protein